MCMDKNCVEAETAINQAGRSAKLDRCIADEINRLNSKGIITIASCCGHGIYPKTIVILHKDGKTRIEKFSKKVIPRKKRFYVKGKEGYYYIPEIINNL